MILHFSYRDEIRAIGELFTAQDKLEHFRNFTGTSLSSSHFRSNSPVDGGKDDRRDIYRLSILRNDERHPSKI